MVMVEKSLAQLQLLQNELELQYFTVHANQKHSVKKCLYIPMFGTSQSYNDKVAEAIACNVAKKVYNIFGQTELSSAMQKEIDAALQTMGV